MQTFDEFREQGAKGTSEKERGWRLLVDIKVQMEGKMECGILWAHNSSERVQRQGLARRGRGASRGDGQPFWRFGSLLAMFNAAVIGRLMRQGGRPGNQIQRLATAGAALSGLMHCNQD